MALTHSRFVPIAFWVGFIALGLFSSLGAPTKPRPAAKASHSLMIAKPGGSALAFDANRSGRDSRDRRFRTDAAQMD